MNSANLTTTFDLYKQNSPMPLVQVKLNVEYDPISNKATVNKLVLQCHINKAELDVTFLAKRDLFGPIVEETILKTDWRKLHQQELIHKHNRIERIQDNLKHNITQGSIKTFIPNIDPHDHEGHQFAQMEREEERINDYFEN